MKITLYLDELEADALAHYCHTVSFFDILKNAKSTEQAHCINDALNKIEIELLIIRQRYEFNNERPG